MFKSPNAFRKSLEDRLKKYAEDENLDLQRIRQKVSFERLLARIFYKQQGDFALKGGYAMELRFSAFRGTKDIDLTSLYTSSQEIKNCDTTISQKLNRLARIDLDDYFTFEIGSPKKCLDSPPHGGVRYSIKAIVDTRLFGQFQLDVGVGIVNGGLEEKVGENWLGFCGISAPRIYMISAEQQFAEKLHAYTLPRGEIINSRAKDLIDMYLLISGWDMDREKLNMIIRGIFEFRHTHSLPEIIPTPPIEWEKAYAALARECRIVEDIWQGFEVVAEFVSKVIHQKLITM